MKLSCPGTHKGRGSPTRSLMHSTTPRHCTIPALRNNSSAEKQELWPASLQKNPRSKADYFKNLRSWKFKTDQKGLKGLQDKHHHRKVQCSCLLHPGPSSPWQKWKCALWGDHQAWPNPSTLRQPCCGPDCPQLCHLPPGRNGQEIERQMRNFVMCLQKTLSPMLKSDFHGGAVSSPSKSLMQ